jgi:DNA processing protein
MQREELAAWLRLAETPHLGRDAVRRLLAAFGSPQAVIEAPPQAIGNAAGPLAVQALSAPPQSLGDVVDATLAWLARADESPRHVIVLGDPRYPPSLLEAPDPPLLLYTQGRTELLHAASVAIVGSRNPTAQGAENARAFAATLSQAGLAIVSGLALGIDGAAHDGALQGAGSTIAVVGTGPDIVYPRRHRELARRIARDGVIVGEYAVGTPSRPLHFPQRNRIIAGLARATLVVEAAVQSGSLITARLAADAGRDVLAIPGSIHSPLSRGCHQLIKQGAKLVDTAQDVLEEIGWGPEPPAVNVPGSRRAGADDPVIRALGHDPVSLDGLVGRTGWAAQALSARLLELELDGQVARLPGQLFQRVSGR